jgi:hypothetical protein
VTGGFVTVGAGGTLLGNGTLGQNVTVTSGTVSAGSTVGRLTMNALTLDSASTNIFDLDVAGATNDVVTVSGNLAPGGSLVTVNITGGTLASGTYRLVNYIGNKTGTFNSAVSVTGSAASGIRLSESTSNQVNLIVNTPPVANTDALNRSSGISMKIPIANLLTNDTDIDGDTVSFVSSSATTTNGATISTDGTYLYVPAATVNDAFTYTIQDGNGGTNTGSVYLVLVGSSGQGVSVSPNTNSTLNVTFFGIPGQTYVVERATNIATPVWVDISTNTAPTQGVFSITDDFSVGLGGQQPDSAFYRLLAP